MSTILFMDFLSQPSRAVYIVLSLLKVDFSIKLVRVSKFENKSEEFMLINPLGQVPVLMEGNFYLRESHAIMRYVIISRSINTSLYPLDDPKTLAKIDEYLDFHHQSTRKITIWLQNINFRIPKGLPVEVNMELAKKEAMQALVYLDQEILSKTSFICGEQMTLADISCFCEVIQSLYGYKELESHKNLSKWLHTIYQIKEIQIAHQMMFKFLPRYNQNPKF